MLAIKLLNEGGLDAIRARNIMVNSHLEMHALQYSQFDSDRSDPVVNECRGLIVAQDEKGEWQIVSRGFDRFYNFGENDTGYMKDHQLNWFEKKDGMMVRIFKFKGYWHIGSKASAYAGQTQGFNNLDDGKGVYIRAVTLRLMGLADEEAFQNRMDYIDMYHGRVTYIFELYGPENPIITQYKKQGLQLLAIRSNSSHGDYIQYQTWHQGFWDVAKPVFVGTPEEAQARAEKLDDYKEGFVGYDQEGNPILKVKSSRYTYAHHTTTSFSPEKNATRILVNGEEGEFMASFPKMAALFSKMMIARDTYLEELDVLYHKGKEMWDATPDRKERAMKLMEIVGKRPFMALVIKGVKDGLGLPSKLYYTAPFLTQDTRFIQTYDLFIYLGTITVPLTQKKIKGQE